MVITRGEEGREKGEGKRARSGSEKQGRRQRGTEVTRGEKKGKRS